MHVIVLALQGMRTIDLQMIEAEQLIITYDSNPIINYLGPRKSRASCSLIKKIEDSRKNYYAAIINCNLCEKCIEAIIVNMMMGQL